MRALLATVLALGLVASFAPPLWAQDDKAAARRHLNDGDQKLRRADRLRQRGREERAVEAYEQALASYRAAYEAYASPKIFFPIAQVEERLGLDIEAYGHYRTVVSEAEDLDDNVRAQVERRLAELEERLVLLTVSVQPDGAAIVVDGVVVGASPLQGPIPLFPGEYTLTVTRSGFVSYESAIAGEAGQKLTERVALEAQGSDEGPQVADDDTPVVASELSAPRRKGKLEVIVGASVTGGLVVAATVTGLLAVSKKGDFDDAATPEDRSSAADSGEALALTTDLLWIAAIGAGAATAYYYFRVYRPGGDGEGDASAKSARAPDTWLAPYAHEGGAGLAVGGRF